MRHTILLIVLHIILITTQFASYPRVYSYQNVLERHTLGFPYNISSESISNILESVYKSLGNMSQGSMVLREGNVSQSLYNISKQISDEKLRNMLTDIANSYALNGSVDRETLLKAVELVANSNASLSDVMQFLNVVNSLAQAEGYKDVVAIGENTVAKLLEKLANSTWLQQKRVFVGQVPQELVEALPKIPQAIESMPSLGAASPQIFAPSMQIPSTPLLIDHGLAVLVLGIALTITIIIVFRKAITNAIRKAFVWRRVAGVGDWHAKTFAQSIRKAVANYWRAVKFIESVYMVRKEDSMTHREYLVAVSGRLEGLGAVFEKITQLYEVARYAHNPGNDVDEESEKYLRILTGEKK
ncbi:MAG: DUF4129 domain-containing protein [Ignisphaera sp.]